MGGTTPPENISELTEWLKYITTTISGVMVAAMGAMWKYFTGAVKELRTENAGLREELDKKVDASTLTADRGDDQIWDELKAIRDVIAQHARDDATVHMKFASEIASLASRDDLNRALDLQTERLLARMGKEK